MHLVCRLALVTSLAFASHAFAYGSIGTPAGCNSTFKGNKGAVSACRACVEGGGRYVSSIKTKGAYVCESGGGGGTSGGGEMHASRAVASEPPPKKPKAMPKTSFVTIEPGSFTIGSPESEDGRDANEGQADITLTRAFLMQTTEVTHGAWHFVTGTPSGAWASACGYDCPVARVTFRQALEYLNALSKREKLEPCYVLKKDTAEWPKGLDCKGYRLPTQAEWEYAARAGEPGSGADERDETSWYGDNSNGTVHPVGKKKANAWGLFDMSGNVSEWTWDAYEYTPPEGTDPIVGGTTAQLADGERIVKGGAFTENFRATRPAWRFPTQADSSLPSVGFRPVRSK